VSGGSFLLRDRYKKGDPIPCMYTSDLFPLLKANENETAAVDAAFFSF
jgi:hypothetical protein